ncbi:rhamnogalacturonan acetylesterase [Pseudoxanthomonas sp. SGD-10]|nr:rhamnogalacturonan acetylesterase [Pseudoxanthomonas sp. SGD-10]
MRKVFSCLFVLWIIVAFKPEDKPTLYIIGDSTVRNTNKEYWGWGSLLHQFLDTTKIRISNHAMAGRSTRTFIKEKRWEKVESLLKPGDYLMIQFGHNEGSRPDTSRAGYRGVLRGVGKDSIELVWPDGTREIVFTYGAYLRKFIKEAKAKGATPIILSMIPRNQWDENGKVKRADKDFGLWAKQVAEQEDVYFIDLNKITADKYDQMGATEVKAFFPGDHTHPNKAGALENAASVAFGISKIKDIKLKEYLINR